MPRPTRTRPIPVLINRGSAVAAAADPGIRDMVQDSFARLGRPATVELVEPDGLRAAFARHASDPVVVVGGGDGTLGLAAEAFARTRTALGILPFGRRNELARQLGVPVDLRAAAAVAATGERRRIDVGTVGRRLFVNGVAIGARRWLSEGAAAPAGPGRGAAFAAAWRALRAMRSLRFGIVIERHRRDLRSPVIVVGNMGCGLGEPATRDVLDDAALSVCALPVSDPLDFACYAMRMLFGRARPERDLAEVDSAPEVIVEGDGTLPVWIDGEIAQMTLPLRFRVLPAALGVVAPRVTAGMRVAVARTP